MPLLTLQWNAGAALYVHDGAWKKIAEFEALDVSAVLSALADNKGDILVATANDTFSVVPVGTDGQILVADSAEAAGVKWSDVSEGTSYEGLIPGGDYDFTAPGATTGNTYIDALVAADDPVPAGVRWIAAGDGSFTKFDPSGFGTEVVTFSEGDLITTSQGSLRFNGAYLNVNKAAVAGISSDPFQRLELGSDGLPLYKTCVDTTDNLVGTATQNLGGSDATDGSAISPFGTITVTEQQDYTFVHSGTFTAAGSGAGFGVSTVDNANDNGAWASSDVFTSGADRISQTSPSKTYTVSLAPGTYYIAGWLGGSASLSAQTLDVTYCSEPEESTPFGPQTTVNANDTDSIDWDLATTRNLGITAQTGAASVTVNAATNLIEGAVARLGLSAADVDCTYTFTGYFDNTNTPLQPITVPAGTVQFLDFVQITATSLSQIGESGGGVASVEGFGVDNTNPENLKIGVEVPQTATDFVGEPLVL